MIPGIVSFSISIKMDMKLILKCEHIIPNADVNLNITATFRDSRYLQLQVINPIVVLLNIHIVYIVVY